MTKPNYETYRQYLGALALVLGAFATFNPAEALAADPLEIDASAKQQLQAMVVDVAEADAEMTSWNNTWDNVAWPESTWTQIIIPPKGGGVAPAQGVERLADILAEIA
ncbi:MAG: hypothetical protein R6X02_12970 [Enhygromyxa sp.]